MSDYQVKGSSLRSKIEYVRETFGEAEALALGQEFAADLGLAPLESKWYPFEVFVRLLSVIADRYFGGDRSRLTEVGEFSARKSLSTTYAAFAQGGDFPSFLRRIATLHGRFYNLGVMVARPDAAGRSCTIVLSGAPFYPPEDLYVAQGFYLGAARFLGLGAVRGRMSQRAGTVTFELSW